MTRTALTLPKNQSDYEDVIDILNAYFEGLYDGDVEKLRALFHDDAWLKGNGYRKSRDEWLAAVANRTTPRDDGMDYSFSILSLEIVDDQAMARVDTSLPAAHFIDFLGLLKEEGRWRIVNKMFTTI